jgi:hypothetical protein
MAFDLTRELKAAEAAIAAASKQAKKLAQVGVKPAEIAAAKKLCGALLAERRSLAAQTASYHGAVSQAAAVTDEAMHLIARLRRVGHFILRHDQPKDAAVLHDQLGVGSHVAGVAVIAERGGLVAKAVADPRWAPLFKRRGIAPQAGKRLAEIAGHLVDAGHDARPTDAALPPRLAELLDRVAYLRGAASLAFGTHSAEYAPFRVPSHRGAKRPAAPPPPAPAGA